MIARAQILEAALLGGDEVALLIREEGLESVRTVVSADHAAALLSVHPIGSWVSYETRLSMTSVNPPPTGARTVSAHD